MNWFTYGVGDTVETPIGDAIIVTEPDEKGSCEVWLLKDFHYPSRKAHQLTTFQFSKILTKKKEDVNFSKVKELLESFVQVAIQCDPKSLIPVLQSATGEKWEYHNGDCCNKGHFIRTGVKL